MFKAPLLFWRTVFQVRCVSGALAVVPLNIADFLIADILI
jgi:hypothetical protein